MARTHSQLSPSMTLWNRNSPTEKQPPPSIESGIHRNPGPIPSIESGTHRNTGSCHHLVTLGVNGKQAQYDK
jgi:hypothetical protein